MLSLLIALIGVIATLVFIIGIHECGHFLAARLLGVKVLRFSIGFGKTLWHKYDKKGTEYVFAALPLGGYVKMLDERDGLVPKEQLHLSFNSQPLYKKFIIVAAGPLFNLIFAFVIYWLLFVIGFTSIAPVIGKVIPHSIAAEACLQPQQEIIRVDHRSTANWMGVAIRLLSRTGETGYLDIETQSLKSPHDIHSHTLNLTHWHMDKLKPDPFTSLGFIPYQPAIPAIVGKILPATPAAQSSLEIGDQITALNGEKIIDWLAFMSYIDAHPSTKLMLTVQRNNTQKIILVTTSYRRDLLLKKHGVIGLSPHVIWPKNVLRMIQYSPFQALLPAWHNTYNFIYLNVVVLGKLLTGKASLQSLGGPLTIFQNAGGALNQGIVPFLSFLAFLSISIGIINIFPLPGLDGGHLLFQLIETIIRRPISQRVLAFCYRMGFTLLLLLIIQAVINDVLRLQ